MQTFSKLKAIPFQTSRSLAGRLLAHWGRVTHICVCKLTTTDSDNGLSPGRRQAIIWTNTGILLIWPLGTNFSEILIKIQTFSFTKMHLKISSAKWRPFCLGLNVLKHCKQFVECSNSDYQKNNFDHCRWIQITVFRLLMCVAKW